jgi:hypothetical protein
MTLEKSGIEIPDLKAWKRLAPPKSDSQWIDGRSAKEVARCWLAAQPDGLPPEIAEALLAHRDFGPISAWTAEPEAKLRFDSFAGEPRNSDLAVICEDSQGSYLLAVEAKADEPYGETVGSSLASALERRLANERSNGIERITNLAQGLLGERRKGESGVGSLRYQLLTACAGALCEASRLGFDRAVMMVQEFVTDRSDDRKHQENAADLDHFVARLSHLVVRRVKTGELHGPFSVPGTPLLENSPRLYIGKVSSNLRGSS